MIDARTKAIEMDIDNILRSHTTTLDFEQIADVTTRLSGNTIKWIMKERDAALKEAVELFVIKHKDCPPSLCYKRAVGEGTPFCTDVKYHDVRRLRGKE